MINMNKDTYDQIINDIGLDDDNLILNDQDKNEIRQGTVLKLFDDHPDKTLFGQSFGYLR